MRNILFPLLLLVILFLPKSEILAKNTDACTDGQVKAPQFSIETTDKTNCPEDTVCTTQNGTLFRCWPPRPGDAPSQPGAQPGEEAVPTDAGCKPGDKNCSSAKGVGCGTVTGSTDNSGGIMTAIGCIPSEPRALVQGILWYGTMAAGSIAFLLMILGALQLITAEGNPESIKHGQERFYSAIIGLLLIIFSVLLMQVIGVDLLGLRNFTR